MKRMVLAALCGLMFVSCGSSRKAADSAVGSGSGEDVLIPAEPIAMEPLPPRDSFICVIPPPPQEMEPLYTSNTLIILYDAEVGKEPLLKAVEAYKAELMYDYNFISGIAIKIPEGADIEEAIDYFSHIEGVTSVERDHIYHLD